jgi:hypothetical protein
MTTETEYEIPAGEVDIEPGTYLATLTALKPYTLYETSKGWSREMPDDAQLVEAYNKVEWIFHTDDEESIHGSTSTARSERSTLFAWATGLGMAASVVLDRSKPIPASQLIGRSAMVTVVLDKNGYSKIASVVPAPRVKAAAPAVEQEPVADALPFR